MNIIFPKKLVLQVEDSRTGISFVDIALMMTIFAPKKNDYNFAKVTNVEGKAIFTLEDVRESIKADKELFPMDYASSLDECSPEVQIRICSENEVNRAIEAMETYKDVSPINNSLLDAFKHSKNHNIKSMKVSINLDKNVPEKTFVIKAESL
jgi:hypothetical protein